MRERRLVVTALMAEKISFSFGGHEYQGSVKGRHTCPSARPIKARDHLTIAHRGPTGDVLVVALCGCPFFIHDVSRREKKGTT